MAKEVLSESEIDKLLGLLAEDAPSKEAGTKEQMSQDEKGKALSVPERRYFHYDFKRPHKFSHYATQQIEKRFEKAALYMTDRLYKRTGLKCSFSSVVSDELTYEEFLRCVKRPTFFGSYQDSTPHSYSQSKCYSVISKNLLYPIFVNAKTDLEKEDENCPEIYKHFLVAEVICSLYGYFFLEQLISLYDDFKFFSEKGLFVTATVTVGNEEGTVDFYIPHEFFLEVLEPLGEFTQKHTPFARKRLPGNGYVPLGWCEINDENRHLLKAGEVITFAQLIDESVPLVLRENHLMFAEGDVTMVDEDYAVRITKIHANPKDPNVVKHYGDYGLNVLPGNVYACLGEFQIHDEKEVKVGDCIDLNKETYETVDLVERDSGKVLARGELFANGYNFAVKITEVL